MATEVLPASRKLNDQDLLRTVAELRRTDNVTNWYYLAREYLFIAIVVGGSIAFYQAIPGWGISWLWALPITLVAIFCVGASQHRLATLTHEAAHYMLFRNRLLNELVSEWFCMFPILGTTHTYRVQHIGHHQYPNDPDLDPDWSQLRLSGHRFKFPMSRGSFLWHCVIKQLLWPPFLIRYILVRAFFLVDQGDGPYQMKRRAAKKLKLIGFGYHIALLASLVYGVVTESTLFLAWLPAAMCVAAEVFYTLAPQAWFPIFGVKSDIPPRWGSRMRILFNTLLFTTIAWLTHLTGQPWWLYYFVLWMVPLGSSFAFFMILRQLVQHGNADRERFTNTRVFIVHPLISMSVFPIGNDYHLPHHLFPMVPHYNLRRLHRLLMETDEYRTQATVVQGYFVPKEKPPTGPTVLDVMTQS